MTKLRIAIYKVNAWQIRIVTLSFLVICIGSGSQFLVNALAAGAEPEAQNVQATTVILNTPTVRHFPAIKHVHLRHAGVDTFGGYTVTGKR